MISVDIKGAVGDFGIDARFEGGDDVTALVGPSGSGKSTILRAVCGLWTPASGRIVNGQTVVFDTERRIDVPASDRHIGAVFQDPLLFPHLSVRRNLLYGAPDGSSLADISDLLDIAPLLDRMPRHLSGGETQRVALGRALLSRPRWLLLDEPLTGLDDARRAAVLPYLIGVRERLAIPILYVTHRLDEVAQIADRVVTVENGRTTGVHDTDAFARLAAASGLAQG